jgi:arylsulfatase A-like enzyme
VKRAYYALCTHIDHQIRILIGTLREEAVLDDTIIAFVSDQGELLGAHGLFAKRCMLEPSVAIPMIIAGTKTTPELTEGRVDDRYVGLQDVMPTLLTLCGLPVPPSCDGQSAVGKIRRDFFYAEAMEGALATRMIVRGRHKLIWYPAGNKFQLFDLEGDPHELEDLSDSTRCQDVVSELQTLLARQLYGADLAFVQGSKLVGMPAPELLRKSNRGLSGQRGVHFPPPPIDPNPGRVVGAS